MKKHGLVQPELLGRQFICTFSILPEIFDKQYVLPGLCQKGSYLNHIIAGQFCTLLQRLFSLPFYSASHADTQCTQGFLDESVLRSKAALIGRTVERQREQVIIPSVEFTCSGTLTGWRFVAQRINGRGRDSYPELQMWRPQTSSSQVYDIVSSVRVSPQSTSQSNVYTHTLGSPISYQAGDVLGLYHPSADTAAYKILSVENGGPNNYFLQRQDRSSEMFNTQSSGVRVHRDFPLVGAITSEFRENVCIR